MRNSLRVVWVVGMLAALAGLLHQKSAAQQPLRAPMPPNLFTVHKLTDKLFIIAPSGPDMSNIGGNVGVFVTDEGVLVVDTNYYRQRRNGQTVAMAEGVVAEIKKLTNQPIKYVIDTHHHGDHTGGNPVFAKFATIFAQKNVRARLVGGYQSAVKSAPGAVAKAEQELAAAKASGNTVRLADAQEQLASAQNNLQMAQSFDPEKVGPTVSYDGELMFHLGGEEIHVYHPARAHTDGDSLIYFKNANIAHWGDAFANNWVPVIDAGSNGSSLEWLQFIDKGIQLVGENATMVPGHGAIAKAADVRRLRTYFTNLQASVGKSIAAGRTREQSMDEVRVPAYENLPGGSARIRMNVAAVYDELKARP
ncbi:MAG: MBL fold metallo-hydrolase [Vicinamibacterales bacterium]|nr:MBL fold metallo-hydrolase [Vicinamibacterales bacterium]